MKKRFASLLIGGKAAAMPFFIPSPAAASFSEAIFSSGLHLVEHGTGITMISEMGEAPDANGYGGTTAAQICATGANAADTLNVVVTGVSSGETVYLMASQDKDNNQLASFFPGWRLGNTNLRFLAAFDYQTSVIVSDAGNLHNAVGAVSVPVDLAQLNLIEGERIYLQAAVGNRTPDGNFANIRFSELDQVEVSANSCYGGQTIY